MLSPSPLTMAFLRSLSQGPNVPVVLVEKRFEMTSPCPISDFVNRAFSSILSIGDEGVYSESIVLPVFDRVRPEPEVWCTD